MQLGMKIPVFVINGFLESGKTEFIKYTISQPYFKTRGTTLLILCEGGELEYEEVLLKQTKTRKTHHKKARFFERGLFCFHFSPKGKKNSNFSHN